MRQGYGRQQPETRIPTFVVKDEDFLKAFRYWVRRLPHFTDADDVHGRVEIRNGRRLIAEVKAFDPKLRHWAETIATFVAIQYEQ